LLLSGILAFNQHGLSNHVPVLARWRNGSDDGSILISLNGDRSYWGAGGDVL